MQASAYTLSSSPLIWKERLPNMRGWRPLPAQDLVNFRMNMCNVHDVGKNAPQGFSQILKRCFKTADWHIA